MTTPTRKQVVQWALAAGWAVEPHTKQVFVTDGGVEIQCTSGLKEFAAIARSDLEATIAAQAKQLEEMAETLLKIKIQFEDALLYLKRHIPIPAQFTEALSLQPSPEILAARDQRVAEACAKCSECLPVGCGLEGKTLAEAIRAGEWREYL